jgi:5-methylcytosine-specific restriction protein A
MGKLKAIQPRLKPIGSRLKPAMTREESEQQRHRNRDREQHWRKWYKTSRWQKLRWDVLVRDLFTCQMKSCGRIEANTALLVADHKIPHHGDERLFWDRDNLQCLCKPCHDRLKQAEERRSPRW